MICDVCGKFQSTAIGIVDGNNKYMCKECYKKYKSENSCTNLTNNIAEEIKIDKKCLCCGTSLEDITKSGRFGCEKCYDAFFDILGASITNLSETPKLFDVKEKIDSYNQLIENALKRSDYETANNLSKKVNALRSEYEARI